MTLEGIFCFIAISSSNRMLIHSKSSNTSLGQLLGTWVNSYIIMPRNGVLRK